MLVAGPTQVGKTTFICNLLKVADEMFTKKPDFVLLFYNAYQPKYNFMLRRGLIDEISKVDSAITYDDLEEKLEPFKDGNGSLVIFDDLMSDAKTSLEKIFTTLGHHVNASLIYVTQNLFYKSPTQRNISLNLHYTVLMKIRKDLTQIRYLANQLCPPDPKYIMNAYEDATRHPFHIY